MFKRILVPLDGSARAEKALLTAARLARSSGGTILLAQVATIPIMYESYGGSPYAGEIMNTEIENAEAYLETMAQSEKLAGLQVETNVLFGAPAQTLLSMATMFKADLIVMTSQGKTGVKRWVLGSVAQKVARHSPIPVLVLHEAGTMPVGTRRDSSPVRALVTLDGSVLAKTAIEPTAQLITALSAPNAGVLHLLRVVKPLVFDEKKADAEYIRHLQEQGLHKARTYMQSVVEHLREGPIGKLNLTITWSVALGDDVADTIIRVAENGEDAGGGGVPGRCDMIAMATHGRAGFQHWVLGSVTERVLSATRLPLLIVRPEETALQQASEEAFPGGTLVAGHTSA
ncbi:MAG TPA: universal stress protein [Ktedonobacteraceae bacterium]|nr:universal stress protein [Ktedonobacteraceae bacterium]